MSSTDGLRLECARLDGRDCLRIRGLPGSVLAQLREADDAQLASWLPCLTAEALAAWRATPPDAEAGTARLPVMAGSHRVGPDAVCFLPRFPLLASTLYTALIHPALLDPHVDIRTGTASLAELRTAPVLCAQRIDEPRSPDTAVLAIYPSGGELPVNQLKLYIEFSNPMSEGHAARHVRVLRADSGESLEAVFLDMEPELWDRERRRLTLLLDPGRIKRGLVPNATDGYPLRAGVPVCVVVDAAFRDHVAQPLVRAFRAQYRVVGEVRRRLSLSDWHFEYPAAHSREPLRVRFDRPLDHALLQHCLRVTDADRKPLAGETAVLEAETLWQFTPAAPWSGSYLLRVDSRLEDLAGNSLARVFDRDLARGEDAPLPIDVVERPFSCG